MAKIRPYISLDIETTGLNKNVQILELAAVLDDGVSPVEELKKIDYIIKEELYAMCEPYALGMNAWIFEEIKASMDRKETKIPVVKFNVAMQALSEMIAECSKLALEFDSNNGEERPNKRIQLAGKNVGSFDRIVIDRECENKSFTLPNLLQHRTVDVGSLYYTDFGYNASLSDINKITGRKEVSHYALDDALDVVTAIRYKFK